MPARPLIAARFFPACLVILLATLSLPRCPAQTYAAPAPSLAATIEVRLPAEAELWFDGTLTAQAGDQRVFTTPQLRAGRAYTYDVLARWRDGGRDVVRTERLLVRAGEAAVIDFTRVDDRKRANSHMAVRDVVRAAARPAGPLPGHASLMELTRDQRPLQRVAGHMAITEVDRTPAPPRQPATPGTRTVPAGGYMSIVEIDSPRR